MTTDYKHTCSPPCFVPGGHVVLPTTPMVTPVVSVSAAAGVTPLLWSAEDQRLADLAMFNVSHELGDPTRDAPALTDEDAPEDA